MEPCISSPDLSELAYEIKSGQVIPVISNSLCLEFVFADYINAISRNGSKGLSVENRIAKIWAEQLKYSLPDQEQLHSVAQYNKMKAKEKSKNDFSFLQKDEEEKTYIRLLKELYLKEIIHEVDDQRISRIIDEELFSFTDFIVEKYECMGLKYDWNHLNFIAEFMADSFITTSPHTLLEYCLILAKKEPIPLICDWNRENNRKIIKEEKNRTGREPIVFHMFGIEKLYGKENTNNTRENIISEGFILSEDDFRKLIKINGLAGHTRQHSPIPKWLMGNILENKKLLLLGYRLQDLDFRVLLHVLCGDENPKFKRKGILINLSPNEQYGIQSAEDACNHLAHFYNNKRSLEVYWDDTRNFLDCIADEMKKL